MHFGNKKYYIPELVNTAIGHRVVAGGEFFNTSTVITPEVLEEIKQVNKEFLEKKIKEI